MRRAALLLMLTALTATGASAAEKPQRFVVFFTEWSAAIDTPAEGVIAEAAKFAKAHPRAPVRVHGYADPTGSKEANSLLSQLRAQRVSDQLRQDGVRGSRINQVGRGAVSYALTPLESRRVEVEIAP